MNIVDALCMKCGKPMRLLIGNRAICGDCAKKKPGSRQRGITILLALLPLMTLLLSSCSIVPGAGVKPGAPSPGIQPVLVAHQSYRVVTACLDISSSYPRQDFDSAKKAIADGIDAAVQPNEDGMLVYVNWITSNSWDPSSTVTTIRIPPLPADPATPVLQPLPTPAGNPYADAEATKQVNAANAKLMKDYEQLLIQQHAKLSQVQAQVRVQTNRLRTLNPTVDTVSSDMYGCFERASERFQGVGDVKYLLAATDLENSEWSQWIQGGVQLSGVHVRLDWFYCADAPRCAGIMRGWRDVFTQAGATDIRFSDPAQSQALPRLFS